ncbi:pentapeptide repeat-containing protein [Rhodococcus sp. B50]|uniref:pentapeptide repeat-containing protein n=1 Tax=Rhodococcus sp. B50 TaxID=2682847 RepID=UPI001FCF9D17|nr:pentapeptide repeat-containing protein [Rhodococcus sp. B50]MBS9374517.1 Pentapeptide repeat protein MfpA [Rhodococcus sp. B50]
MFTPSLHSSPSPTVHRADLRGDCSRCFALCCTAFGFASSSDFAEDKPAGSSCRHLDARFACTIHETLPSRGFRGCTVFDCFGAGQAVSQQLFAGVSWRDRPHTRDRMFSAFTVMKELHEMMWHLLEAQDRTYDPESSDDARELVESLASLTRRGVDELESLDIGEIRASVRPVLMEVGAEVRASYFADDGQTNPDLVPGADLAGTDLRGHRLCGADLRNALLIGADLRGCDLAGADLLGADLRGARVQDADLSFALYLTGPQLAAARGNRRTRVPADVPVPRSWLDE